VEQGGFGSQYEAGMRKHFGISAVSCRLRVNRVILVVGRLLPVLLWKRTLSGSVAMSEKCH
jgi:hypothetical protein